MNNKIVFPELVDMLTEINGTSRKISETFLKELFNILKKSFENGESVRIKNFGVFKVVKTESRKSVDINTGKEIEIPEHNRITFTPDKEVTEAVNKSFAGFDTVDLDNDISEEEIAKLSETGEKSEEILKTEEVQAEETEKASADKSETVVVPEPTPEEESEELPEEPEVIKDSIAEPEQLKSEKEEQHIEPESGTKVKETETPQPFKEEKPEQKEVQEESEHKVEEVLHLKTAEDPKKANKSDVETESETSEDNPQAYIDNNNSNNQKKYQAKFNKGFLWGIISGVVLTSVLFTSIFFFIGVPIVNTEKVEYEAIPEAIQDAIVAINISDSIEKEKIEKIDKPKVITDTVLGNKFLTTMAREYYGNFNFWVYIYEENKDKIKNPDRINRGTIVVIPPAEKYGIDKNDPASVKRAEKKAREFTYKFKN